MRISVSNLEIRAWRNAFYGLPASYKAGPTLDYGWYSPNHLDCRSTKIDAAALFRSIDRSRKGKLTGVWA